MSPITIARYAWRIAEWITPHVQGFARNYSLNAREADRHYQRRNYREAAQYYALSLQDANKRRSAVRKKLQIILRLAECQLRCGDLEKALATGQDALERATKVGEKDPFYGAVLNVVAQIQEERGEQGEALSLSRKALTAAENGKSLRVLAECTARLARLEKSAGNMAESKKLMAASNDCARRAHGAQHHDTATQLAALALVLQEEGQLDEALPLFKQAHAVHKVQLGETARETLTDLEHIGQIQYLQRNLDGALANYASLARLKENEIGSKPVEHAKFLIDAATVHEAAGEFGKAQEFLMQANQKAARDAELLPVIAKRLARLKRF